jgi:hypothetical protein
MYASYRNQSSLNEARWPRLPFSFHGKAEQALAKTDIWAICGYSFPDADMHVKYLLKRVQVNSPKQRRVFVFNWHPTKSLEEAEEEESRLRSF